MPLGIRQEYKKQWNKNHPEECRKYNRKWRKKNREKIKTYYHQHREQFRQYDKKHYQKLKGEIIQLLGNKCTNPYNLPHPDWCNDPRCLQIDHVHGDGYKERKLFRSVNSYYKGILGQIKFGSKDYQLLCANCNWIKKFEKKEV